jgi:hypothetical protein
VLPGAGLAGRWVWRSAARQDHDGSVVQRRASGGIDRAEQVAAVGGELGIGGVRRAVWGSEQVEPYGLVDVGQTA